MSKRGIAHWAGTARNFWLKRQDKRKNRRATRAAIHRDELDKIPPRHKVKGEDRWAWD